MSSARRSFPKDSRVLIDYYALTPLLDLSVHNSSALTCRRFILSITSHLESLRTVSSLLSYSESTVQMHSRYSTSTDGLRGTEESWKWSTSNSSSMITDNGFQSAIRSRGFLKTQRRLDMTKKSTNITYIYCFLVYKMFSYSQPHFDNNLERQAI